jgi:hypothetical protein
MAPQTDAVPSGPELGAVRLVAIAAGVTCCEHLIFLAEKPPVPPLVCPSDVCRALAVARLAAGADLGPACRISIVGGIVILVYARRMALGAHEIPVLIELGPVHNIVVANFFVGIEMEPALSAFLLLPAIPGKG